ncbi:MAG: hypothetical protein M1814_004833 [Vezdaea aestivalis]|nr:MAG: hypothetical protein M1814_004833 [Vezdaea aestivalis]
MRTPPKLTLNLSFQPTSTAPASPSPRRAPPLTLQPTTYTPPTYSPPSYSTALSSSPISTSPTTLNTRANQSLTLSSYQPSDAPTTTTTLTYTPYTRSEASPKSILKRRESDNESVASTPASGRSIRFLDVPEVHTISPIEGDMWAGLEVEPPRLSRDEKRWGKAMAMAQPIRMLESFQ